MQKIFWRNETGGRTVWHKDVVILFTKKERKLILECIGLDIPLLVSDTTPTGWYRCPKCGEAIDPDFIVHCKCCGQNLCRYGTEKAIRQKQRKKGKTHGEEKKTGQPYNRGCPDHPID